MTAPEAIEIYVLRLDTTRWEPARWLPQLGAAEQQRAARFVLPADRTRFAATRAALRQLLARRLGCEPDQVAFDYEPAGRPRLAGAAPTGGLDFNVSHSGDRALIAIGPRPVGVDVEKIRSDLDLAALAQRFFAPAEQAALERLPPAQRSAGFFRCWTLKEAYLKARGVGLSGGLGEFAVDFTGEAAPALSWAADDAAAPQRWQFCELAVAAGYAAAAAFRAGLAPPRVYEWAGS